MIILYSILFVLLLIGLLVLMFFLYQKEFIEWNNGKIRGMTDKAQEWIKVKGPLKKDKLTKDIEREFRKLDKVKS